MDKTPEQQLYEYNLEITFQDKTTDIVNEFAYDNDEAKSKVCMRYAGISKVEIVTKWKVKE